MKLLRRLRRLVTPDPDRFLRSARGVVHVGANVGQERELYRRHKVNHLAGCLPMLVQLPVFIGLYNVLLQSIELRHAPFFGWMNDLSQPDRLGALAIPFVAPPGIPVMTLLMGVSMIIQQKMTPSTADPAQQRVMMIMPVVFTVMFVNFPAGLVLYWLSNNVLSIAQQALSDRQGK
jgi:YidC/Oxa1 family membrane protein insertase